MSMETEQKKEDGNNDFAISSMQTAAIIKYANEGIILIDKEGGIVIINPAAERMFGYQSHELDGKPIEILLPDFLTAKHETHREQFYKAPVNRTMGTGKELFAKRKDSTLFQVEISLSQYKAEGKTYTIAFIADITLRKEQEKKLKEKREAIEKLNTTLEQQVNERTAQLNKSEKHFRALIENSADAITLLDENGLVIYSSPATERILGYTLEERKGKKGLEMADPEDIANATSIVQSVWQKPGIVHFVEVRLKNKAGNIVWVEASLVNRLHDADIQAVVLNYSDITERKLAEIKLAATNRELNKLFNTIDEVLFSVDLVAYKTIQMSAACKKVYGYEPEDFIANPNLWKEVIHPDDLHIVETDNVAMLNGQQIDHQYRVYHKDGSIRWLEVVITPTVDGAGKVVRIDGLSRDITQRKNAELALVKMNEELEKRVKERTAELEAFSYTISHDLQQPLRVVSGFSHILLYDYKDNLDEEGRKLLQTINTSVIHMGRLIKDVLDLSRLDQMVIERTATDMNELVNHVIAEIKLVHQHAPVSFSLTGNLPVISAHRILMKQVWANLLANAVKYSAKKEKPHIEIGVSNLTGEHVYYVKDNGAGFDMAFADNLFDVFKRMHDESEFEGTGVGLATVKRIITRHNGKVWAEAEPDKGATFYFTVGN